MAEATADVRELFERVRCGERGVDDLVAMLALMQGGGNLDMSSLLTGMLLGSRGGGGVRGLDRSALLMLAITAGNNNAAMQASGGTGAPVLNPLQQLLPLLLLMGCGFGDGWERSLEVFARDKDRDRDERPGKRA